MVETINIRPYTFTGFYWGVPVMAWFPQQTGTSVSVPTVNASQGVMYAVVNWIEVINTNTVAVTVTLSDGSYAIAQFTVPASSSTIWAYQFPTVLGLNITASNTVIVSGSYTQYTNPENNLFNWQTNIQT